jgi:hypothetical protein
MNQEAPKSKPEKKNREYKDWDRHARVVNLLQKKRKTITEMSDDIGERIQHVSTCIWGIPGRRVLRIEEKISAYLGIPRDDLFINERIA